MLKQGALATDEEEEQGLAELPFKAIEPMLVYVESGHGRLAETLSMSSGHVPAAARTMELACRRIMFPSPFAVSTFAKGSGTG